MNEEIGRYKYLFILIITGMVTIWSACGYPLLHQECGKWIVCAEVTND